MPPASPIVPEPGAAAVAGRSIDGSVRRVKAQKPRPAGRRAATRAAPAARQARAPRRAATPPVVAVAKLAKASKAKKAPRLAPPRPPAVFVGRDRELAQLERGLARVPVAVVCGLAGVGKSSLAYAAAEGWKGPTVHARATGPELTAVVEDLRRAVTPAAAELRTDDERCRALARALDDAGALAVVDDLHVLAPDAQARLLGAVGAHLARGRLIATSRERPASAQGYDRVEIHLGGLPARAARELWSALDELRGATAGFQRAFDATGGNPFLLRRRHAGDPSGPDPLAAAVAQLAPDRARLLGALALARVPLAPDEVAAMAGGDPRAALADLRRALLIDVDGSGHPLVHELVREAAAATLGDERRPVHAALATTLGERRDVASITAAAHHWLDAGQPARARDHLVARAKDLLDQGASLELAAIATALPAAVRDPDVAALHARALVRLVDVAAGEHALRDALAARPPSSAVLLPLATLALLAGRFTDARAALARAATDADLAPVARANLVALEAAVRFHTDAPPAALEHLAAATEGAQGAARALLWASATYLSWLARYAVGGERRGAPTSDNRAPAAHGYRAAALGALAFGAYDVATTPADSARALTVMEGVLAGHHDPLSQIHAEALRGLRQWERGDRLAALDALRALTARAEEAGYVLGVLWTQVFAGRILHVLGRRTEARAVLASVADRARALGAPVLARAAINAASDDPVTRLAMAVRDEAGPPSPSVRTRAFQAIAAALRGDDAAVARALADADERPGYHVEIALAHLARGLVGRRAGDPGAWPTARAAAERVLTAADPDLLDGLLAVVDVDRDPDRPTRAAPVVIDTARHEVVAGARVVSLSSRPVLRRILYALAERVGETLSKDDLTRAAWSQEYDPLRHDNPLFVNLSRLRQLLRDTGLTVDVDNDRGGYRLTCKDQLVLRRPR